MIYLQLAKDLDEVIACIDEELFDRIAEDGVDYLDFKIDDDNGKIYMMIYSLEQPIGFWLLYPVTGSTLNIHCNIREPFRYMGNEAARLILTWFVTECPERYQKLNAEIPVIYPEVYHFTKKQGFQDEGINRSSILKQGVLVDQWRLGITRQEVAEQLGVNHGFH